MGILMVTGIDGAKSCAEAVSARLGLEVEVAEGRREALEALRRHEFLAVVMDETMAECDPAAAEAIWEHSGLSIPLQVNFAVSGTERLVREIRAGLRRRERERMLSRKAAAAEMETEMKSTLAALLLNSQLALAGSEIPLAVEEKIRVVAELAGNLRQQLSNLRDVRGGVRA